MNTKLRCASIALTAAAMLSAVTAVSAQTTEPDSTNPTASTKFTETIANKAGLPTTTADVQAKRDDGWGWGAIANALGFNLGSAVSAANQDRRAERQDTAASEQSMGNRGNSGEGGRGNGNGGGNGGGGNGGGGGRR